MPANPLSWLINVLLMISGFNNTYCALCGDLSCKTVCEHEAFAEGCAALGPGHRECRASHPVPRPIPHSAPNPARSCPGCCRERGWAARAPTRGSCSPRASPLPVNAERSVQQILQGSWLGEQCPCVLLFVFVPQHKGFPLLHTVPETCLALCCGGSFSDGSTFEGVLAKYSVMESHSYA